MKFIGQYIQSFIARFRNDVFLEDVSSGTIASGGNLGLDSNNKIVKANEPTSHDAVTLAGTPDYITLSGQEITRNAIDLVTDVTGTLIVGKGGTGATSLTTNAVLTGNGSSAIQAESTLSYSGGTLLIGTSDSTGAIIQKNEGGSGRLTIQAGNATASGVSLGGDLRLFAGASAGPAAGGSIKFFSTPGGTAGVGVLGTHVEIAGLDSVGNLQIDGGLTIGSTQVINSSAQVSASAIPTLNQDTTGNAATATKQIFVTTHNFQLNNTTGVKNYVPFNNLNESTGGAMSNYWTRTLAPYPGTIKKIAVRSQTSLGSSCTLRISKITDTTDALPSGTHVDNTSVDLSTAHTTVVTTMNTNSFAAGDVVGVALERSAGTAAQVVLTIVWEYTT